MEGFQILIRLLVFLSHSSHSISGCCLIKVFYVTLYPPGLLPEFLLWRLCFWKKKKKLCNKKPGPATKVCSWLSGLLGNPLPRTSLQSSTLSWKPIQSVSTFSSPAFCIQPPCSYHTLYPLVSLEVPQLSHLYIKMAFRPHSPFL